MDRSWLETVHLLGLDVEIAIVAVLVALEALTRLVERLRAERKARPRDARPGIRPAQPGWPPEVWRSNP
jgi:hypothetical protein